MSQDYHRLAIKDETRSVYEEARQAVMDELGGEEPTHDAVIREMAEAYVGRHALGEWQHIDVESDGEESDFQLKKIGEYND